MWMAYSAQDEIEFFFKKWMFYNIKCTVIIKGKVCWVVFLKTNNIYIYIFIIVIKLLAYKKNKTFKMCCYWKRIHFEVVSVTSPLSHLVDYFLKRHHSLWRTFLCKSIDLLSQCRKTTVQGIQLEKNDTVSLKKSAFPSDYFWRDSNKSM